MSEQLEKIDKIEKELQLFSHKVKRFKVASALLELNQMAQKKTSAQLFAELDEDTNSNGGAISA